jgi:cytochrome c oxidase cbb3-type subunit 4
MDINVLRSVSTVLAFVCFVGIVWWAYRRRTQKEFAVAEQLPFADGGDQQQPRR